MLRKPVTIGTSIAIVLGLTTINLPVSLDADVVFDVDIVIDRKTKTNGHIIKARGNVEVQDDVIGTLIMANSEKAQRLFMRKELFDKRLPKIERLVIGESPSNVELDSDIVVGELVVNDGAKLKTNGYTIIVGTGSMIIGGTLDATGSDMEIYSMEIYGNVQSARNIFVKNEGEIYQTTKERTIIIPAVYGPRYSETGAVLYGTGQLITATGSRIEYYQDVLGDLEVIL